MSFKRWFTGVTIGGPESGGDAAARTQRFPVNSLAMLNKEVNKNPDEVITGRMAKRGFLIDSYDAAAEIACDLAACPAIGMAMASALGGDVETPVEVGGAILVRYTGSDASCKLAVAAAQITSETGALGAEEADSDFGTAGDLDTSEMNVDSVVAAIDAYTDYSAKVVFGDDSVPGDALVTITATQAKGRNAIIFFGKTGSGMYLHKMKSLLTNVEYPHEYTLQFDGSGGADNLGNGAMFDSFSLSADLKARATISFNAIMKGVGDEGTASTLAVHKAKPMRFNDGMTFVAGTEHTYTKNISLDLANNHDTDEGYGQGSLYRQSHVRGALEATGSVTIRANSVTESERLKHASNAKSSLLSIFKGSGDEYMLFDLPQIMYTDESKSEGGVSLEQQLTYEAVYDNTENPYDDMLSVYMVSHDSATYGYSA